MTSVTETGVITEAPTAAPASVEPKAGMRAWYALFVLIVAMLFAFITRQILILLVQPIKQDLSLSDLQIGETHGLGPAIFAVVAMFPLAWLADRFERRSVLAVCVIFWSIATAISGFAVNFWSLQACVIAIVIAEAGLTPIVYSLIADIFPPKQRARANIIAYGASALGQGLGLAAGGALIAVVGGARLLLPGGAQELETWRLAFFLVAVPGPLVALAVVSIGRTSRKSFAPQASAAPAPAAREAMLPYIRQHGLVALGAFGTMAFFAFGLQAMANWLPVALIRNFKSDAAAVGVQFGLTFMAGAAIGLVLATLITPYWRKVAGTAFVLRAIGVAAAAAAVPVFLLGFAQTAVQAYALVFVFSILFITGVALMPGMMQDVAPAGLRARVIAAGTVVFMVLGAVSPPLVGFISDQFPGNPRALMWAVVGCAVGGFLVCSILARFMEEPYRRTVAVVAEA